MGVGSWRATIKLLNIIQRFNPDVVHLRNLHGNFVNIPMLLRYLGKNDIPTVVQTDDCFWFTGGCMHFTVNGCEAWKKDCQNCQYLKRGKNFLLSNRAAAIHKRKVELFSTIPRLAAIGVSKWTKEQIRLSAVFRNATIIDYVYNWINLDVFCPKGLEVDKKTRETIGLRDEQTMVLGVASKWGLNKGLHQYILLSRLLPTTTRIFLVGDIDSEITLPENIIALGSTESTEQLANLYSAADVFVHLSLEETFGKVTAEALSCGTPAIVYDSTASPELVDEKTGSVVKPGDLETVAYSINNWENLQPTKNCRKRAEALFELGNNCSRQMTIYNKIQNTFLKD